MNTQHNSRTTHLVGLLWVLPLLALGVSGCSRPREINTVYGERNSSEGGPSVNGTGALAKMFEQAGHSVSDWNRLSPRINSYDTIVWVPNDFAPPTFEQREFLENWLEDRTGRTLVYIGRDYDAGPDYWRRVQPAAPVEQATEVARRLATAQAEFDSARAEAPKSAYARWFTLYGQKPRRPVRSLAGPWSDDIDPARVEITLGHLLDASIDADKPKTEWKQLPEREILLTTGDSPPLPIAVRLNDNMWYGSHVIVVANGSFLLNLPLVNHEHRKLAARLVEECGTPGNVLFLESGPGGPAISKKDARSKHPTGIEWLTEWPINVIAMHLLILGVVYIATNFAIFGRPRVLRFSALLVGPGLRVVPITPMPGIESEAIASADFGKHLQALGDLLEKTQDVGYAQARLQYYQQHVKRDSGASHGDGKKK